MPLCKTTLLPILAMQPVATDVVLLVERSGVAKFNLESLSILDDADRFLTAW